MSRVFIIHGYGDNPDGGWKPWVSDELKKKGYDVFVPVMPNTDHPRVGPWTEKIRTTVEEPHPDDIFIGYSLGCIAIIRSLETLAAGQSVGRCIFVAGFYEELGDEYAELRSFLDHPVDWNAVKSHCKSFSVIHSDDDDAVPVQRAKDLAEKLGVELELHHGYKHFSGNDGVIELPLVLEKIR